MVDKKAITDFPILIVAVQKDLAEAIWDNNPIFSSDKIIIIPGWMLDSINRKRLLGKNICGKKVYEIKGSEKLQLGKIYLTPESLQVEIKNNYIQFNTAVEIPSLDILLSSFPNNPVEVKYINSNAGLLHKNEVVQNETIIEVAKFRLLFENSMHAFFCTDANGSILEANRAACKMFGYTLKELQTKGISILESSEKYFQLRKERVEKGSASGIINGIRKNGEKFQCQYSSTLFMDSQGNSYASTILIDISEKEKSERMIIDTSRFMKMILDNTRESFIILDHDLKVVSFNKMAELFSVELIGVKLEIGNSILSLADKESFKRLDQMYAGILKGNSLNTKYTVSGKINPTIFKISYSPIANEDGLVSHIMINAKDITAEEIAMEQIQKERVALQLALEEIERIMSSSPDVICTIECNEGKFLQVSSACEKILGFKKEEMRGRKFNDFVYSADLEKSGKVFRAILNGLNVTNFENRYVKKDGQLVNLIWSANFIAKDNIVYAIAKDASEKIMAEEALYKSEEKYRHLFYSNPIPMWIYEHSTKAFLEVNDAAIEHYGYTRDEFLSKTLFDIRSPEEALKLASLSRPSNGSEFFHYNWKHIKKNDEVIDVEITSHVIDYNGVNAILVSSNDISARIRLENDLMKYNATVKNILESITDGFLSVDNNWIIRYSNKEAEKLIGKKTEEIVGQNLWKVNQGRIPYEFYKQFNKAIKKKKSVLFEQYLAADNIWVEITAYPSLDGLSIYFKNITDRKTVEKHINSLNNSLQKRASELIASNEELEKFAYVASHDLQEPLRMITSFLQLFEQKYKDKIDETGNRYIHFAVDGAKRMNRLILDLLEYSKLGNKENAREKIDITEIIEELKENFRQKISDSNALIICQDLPVIDHAVRSHIYQLFQNLIGNALKYQPVGQSPEISINCKTDNENWLFCVRDNGIGIEDKFASKIFVIFQRLHSKNEYSGTGIGLAICKKIVELHGGNIWVDAELNKGSAFYFTLPREIKEELNIEN